MPPLLLSLRAIAIGVSCSAIALFPATVLSQSSLSQNESSPVRIAQGASLDSQADALLQQGALQLQQRQVEAALQSWHEALELFGNRAIGWVKGAC
ncbi:MAG: hypothetical protein AAFY26_01310 [Cyanobacteria bacterium J06638_22]